MGDEFFEHDTGILGTAETRIENLMVALAQDTNPDKIGCAHLTQLLVNVKIAVGKKRKRDVVGLAEVLDLVS